MPLTLTLDVVDRQRACRPPIDSMDWKLTKGLSPERADGRQAVCYGGIVNLSDKSRNSRSSGGCATGLN